MHYDRGSDENGVPQLTIGASFGATRELTLMHVKSGVTMCHGHVGGDRGGIHGDLECDLWCVFFAFFFVICNLWWSIVIYRPNTWRFVP